MKSSVARGFWFTRCEGGGVFLFVVGRGRECVGISVGGTSSEREAQLKLFFSLRRAALQPLEIFREEEQIPGFQSSLSLQHCTSKLGDFLQP